MDLFIFILALIVLMYLIYKGKNIIIIVPLMLAVIILLTGQINQSGTYAWSYLTGMTNFITTNALLFFLGVLFGGVISATGFAHQMAQFLIDSLGEKRVILALILLTNAMMLGGISGFIIIFTMFPIAHHVFEELKIPKRFIFGLIAVAMATYMIGAFPGALQVQNILPIGYLSSTIFSGAWLGIPMTLYLFTTGYLYLMYRIRRVVDFSKVDRKTVELKPHRVSGWILFSPLVVVFLGNLFFSQFVYRYIDLTNHQRTLFSINSALILGIVLTLILGSEKYDFKEVFLRSFKMALKPLFFVGTTVGFGVVISQMPFLNNLRVALLEISPIYSLPLTVAIFAAISGSATGGIAIAFPFLGTAFLDRVAAEAISHDTLHRLAVMSSVTIDTLPTNGTTLTMLKVTNLSYKEIYFDYFMITVLNTSIALMIALFLASIFN